MSLAFAQQVCSWVPLGLWHRLMGVELLLPHWHLASDRELKHISGLYKCRTVSEFKADIEFFLGRYTPITLQDVIDHLDGIGQLPRRCFLPTFDDGFREIHDVVAPILHAQGVPAVFFLVTSVLDNRILGCPQKRSLLLRALRSRRNTAAELAVTEILKRANIKGSNLPRQIRNVYHAQRAVLDELAPVLDCDFPAYVASAQPYLTSQQIRSLLKMGFAIGAHSIDHPMYAELSQEEQLRQTTDSIAYLSNSYGCLCQSFAFPYVDAGVSLEFFRIAFANGQLKVSFGTGGVRRHFFPRNLSRFTMERTTLPAAQIVANMFAKCLVSEPAWAEQIPRTSVI